MVNRVHGDTADMRTEAEIAFASGFSQLDVHVVEISDLADNGFAFDVKHADFIAWKLYLRIIAFLGTELGYHSCRSCDFCAAARLYFDAVYVYTHRNMLEFKRVSWLDVGFFAADHLLEFRDTKPL